MPFYNEQDNIEPLLREISSAMAGERWELIAVDDCSTDGSAAVLERMQTQIEQLRVFRHQQNSGQSAAICSGVSAARGAWVVTLDGDGQNDPADVPRLLEYLQRAESEPAMICGFRQSRQDNRLRRWSSKIANTVRGGLLGDGTPDTGCGLKLFQREVFLRLPRFNHMHRFLPALVQRDGGLVVSVVVTHRPRTAGQSKYGVWNRLWVGIVDLWGVMWLQRRRMNPGEVKEKLNDN